MNEKRNEFGSRTNKVYDFTGQHNSEIEEYEREMAQRTPKEIEKDIAAAKSGFKKILDKIKELESQKKPSEAKINHFNYMVKNLKAIAFINNSILEVKNFDDRTATIIIKSERVYLTDDNITIINELFQIAEGVDIYFDNSSGYVCIEALIDLCVKK